MPAVPEFSIVTPSLNQLGYLKRCVRSVADQAGVDLEHLVMDGGSTDGTVEWLRARPELLSRSERDQGMYDAVNKGFERARGDVLSYLNCDEQYLPGALRAVREHLRAHPEVDFVYGDMLLIRPDGSLAAYRKAYPLRWPYVPASHLYAPTCTLFLRRRVVEEGNFYDFRLRDTADADFVVGLLRRGYRASRLRRYLAAFTLTGSNMCLGPNARREAEQQRRAAPAWVRHGRLPLNLLRLGEKALAGAYRQPLPLVYWVYASEHAAQRTRFQAERASFRWKTG